METLFLSSGALRQGSFDQVGSGKPYQAIKLKTGSYSLGAPIKLNDGTVFTSEKNALITLEKNVSVSAFPSMTPLFGQKNSTIKDIVVDGVQVFGNGGNQLSPRGAGFHNCYGFKNCSNIEIKNISLTDTLGDGLRATKGVGIRFNENVVYKCGHDALYVDGGEDVTAFNNTVGLRTNSAFRMRHVHGAHLYNNKIKNVSAGIGTGPGIQLEVSSTTLSLSDILIEGNTFDDTYGPGIWAICQANKAQDAATGVIVRNNTFTNCGLMPVNLPGTGGIACDGVNMTVEGNEFNGCSGYGVLFGPWINMSSPGTGYTAIVKNNVFKNQKLGKVAGEATGTALANILPKKYTVTASGNTFINNYRDLYQVTELAPEDPEDPGEPEEPKPGALVLLSCSEEQREAILQKIPGNNILRRV
jgi:hypothetical protein